MRVKLVRIERDFRGRQLSRQEEILQAESSNIPTPSEVAQLIARHHPELQFLVGSEEFRKSYFAAIQMNVNRWVYVYAQPLAGTPAEGD